MSRLFFVALFFSISVDAQKVKPLRFKEDIHDFGYVDQDAGPVTYSFQFVNVSNRPVKILTVQASCGCTTPNWSKDPVVPGANGFIEARFDPKGRPGYFNKSLTVTTDFDSNPVILQIKAQVSTGAGASRESMYTSPPPRPSATSQSTPFHRGVHGGTAMKRSVWTLLFAGLQNFF